MAKKITILMAVNYHSQQQLNAVLHKRVLFPSDVEVVGVITDHFQVISFEGRHEWIESEDGGIKMMVGGQFDHIVHLSDLSASDRTTPKPDLVILRDGQGDLAMQVALIWETFLGEADLVTVDGDYGVVHDLSWVVRGEGEVLTLSQEN